MQRLLMPSTLVLSLVPFALHAEGTRELGAHEHGAGALNIAFEGNNIAMELEAPGADIVGFEYAAKSEEDRAKVDTAISDLARPLDLFVFPAEAGCTVTAASVTIVGEEAHGHDEEHAHGDKARSDEKEHAHGDEAHEEHEEHADGEASHNEFHAEYEMACANPGSIEQIELVYFDRFPNAAELEVQVVSDQGASSFEVGRESPVLDMRGMF